MATAILAFDMAQTAVRQAEHSLDSDHSLITRCLDGDDAAWEELVRQYSRQVYGLCYRFTGSGPAAQDLTQEVYLRVFRTLKTFRAAEGSFGTWNVRNVRNTRKY